MKLFDEIERRLDKKSQLAIQYKVASIAYGLFFCLCGVVLTTIEPFKTCSSCNSKLKIVIECFFIYMYAVSILWIILMCFFIIRSKRELKVSIRNPTTGSNRRLSLVPKNVSTYKSNFQKLTLLERMKNIKFFQTNNDSNEIKRLEPIDEERRVLGSAADISKFDFTYDYENGTGELYMRCGTAIFSICFMIEICLSLIQMLEAYMNNHSIIEDCRETFVISVLSKVFCISFVFFQTFFIFKYANIIINYGKNSACIGLMHLVVTNVCVSLRAIVSETVSEIGHHNEHLALLSMAKAHSQHSSHELHHRSVAANSNHILSSNHTKLENYVCLNHLAFESTGVLAGVQEAEKKLAPYLYPCIIEYSLMSMTVFFIIWESIETKFGFVKGTNSRRASKIVQTQTAHSRENSQSNIVIFSQSESEYRKANEFTVDCGKSTTGLFIGMIVLLLTLISLISYFIYKNISDDVAKVISKMSEICLICFSMFVAALTYIKLKYYKFQQKYADDMSYNEILIIVGLAGIYLFAGYSIIAIISSGVANFIEALSLSIQVLSVVESTFQSILIINCLKMYTKNIQNKKNKPARSSIILLILIDVSLWLMETFSIKKYDMNQTQLDYFDIVFWSIVSSISSPFAIFFRFHASVCLCDIWKTLYE